jgi:uncharacterized protein YeaO (DUF488 family)
MGVRTVYTDGLSDILIKQIDPPFRAPLSVMLLQCMIQIKKVYDPPDRHDGIRYLVERLWPRGMKKERLQIDGWLKDLAPSDALRKWFGHDPAKWEEFRRRYVAELERNRDTWKPILDVARKGTVTLIYSAHDQEHNSALALKAFLEERLTRSEQSS